MSQLQLRSRRRFNLVMEASASFFIEGNMRKLTTPDVFNGVRLMISTGMKNELKQMFMDKQLQDEAKELVASVGSEDGMAQVGLGVVLDIIGKCAEKKCEEAIYQFFSGPFEMEVEEIKELPLLDFVSGIIEVAEIEEWVNFFTNVFSTLGIPSLRQSA